MSSLIVQLVGKPGTGKSTALRTLDPSTTVIISADRKGMSYAGWKKDYSESKKNYFQTDDYVQIFALLQNISTHANHVKVVVIDTVNSMLDNILFQRRNQKTFDKYTLYANAAEEVYDLASRLREDLIVVFIGHTTIEKVVNEHGEESLFETMAFSGQKLKQTNLHKHLVFNLFMVNLREEDGPLEYKIRTISNGKDTCRSPIGVLDDYEPADMNAIIEKIRTNYLAA